MPVYQFSLRCLFLIFSLLVATAAHAQRPGGLPANGPTTLLTSDSVRLFVQLAGQGNTPCVFVHGGPGAGSYTFEKLGGNQLESSLRLIYYDQRGSGRSASPRRPSYSMARMVQDLEELRQHLGLERWVLLAHSFGGTIATAYAAQYPQRVQALVLVNAVLNPPASLESTLAYGTSLLPAAAQPNPALPLFQRFGMMLGALQQQKLSSQLQYSHDSLAARAGRVARAVPANQDFARQVFGGQLPDYGQDYTATTATLQMPVLNIVGQDDCTTGATPASLRFPHLQTVTLPGKHYAFLEQPTAFREAVVRFVQKLPRRS